MTEISFMLIGRLEIRILFSNNSVRNFLRIMALNTNCSRCLYIYIWFTDQYLGSYSFKNFPVVLVSSRVFSRIASVVIRCVSRQFSRPFGTVVDHRKFVSCSLVHVTIKKIGWSSCVFWNCKICFFSSDRSDHSGWPWVQLIKHYFEVALFGLMLQNCTVLNTQPWIAWSIKINWKRNIISSSLINLRKHHIWPEIWWEKKRIAGIRL
jgi:hypothetical protein